MVWWINKTERERRETRTRKGSREGQGGAEGEVYVYVLVKSDLTLLSLLPLRHEAGDGNRDGDGVAHGNGVGMLTVPPIRYPLAA